MKRGVITTISQLKPGDRFYKLGSQTKKPLQFLKEDAHGKFETVDTDSVKVGSPIKPKDLIVLKGSLPVVFLRNATTKP